MNIRKLTCLVVNLIWFACLTSTLTADYFVAVNGTGDGTGNWGNATNSLQGAINAASAGSVIWVSNGIYRVDANGVDETGTNVVYVDKSLHLRAWDKTEGAVVIDGGGSNRCVRIMRTAPMHVTLEGFTITNGFSYSRGGGVYINGSGSGTAEVHRCFIIDNNVENFVDTTRYRGGGGVYLTSVLGFKGVISNCVIRGNRTINTSGGYASLGGGAWLQGSTVYGTEFSENQSCGSGGGIWSEGNMEMLDCRIDINQSANRGGGLYIQGSTLMDRCYITGNSSTNEGGGVYVTNGGELRNSLVADNRSFANLGGGIYAFYGLWIYNCTIAGNTAGLTGGVHVRGDANPAIVINSIIYENTALSGDQNNYNFASPNTTVSNTCTTPLSGLPDPDAGNIEGPPLFVGGGDYRLTGDSPCINAGVYLETWMNGALDLDRQRRVSRYSGLTDMGCYEYYPRGSLFWVK